MNIDLNRLPWHELSNPRTYEEKGGEQGYYDHARPELIALLDHVPRVVLDIGCAGGALGKSLKERHPGVVVTGIELSEEAVALAATRIDRALSENVEKLDFQKAGFGLGSIDAVFFPDILEHLYDPWNLLARIKPYLARDAQVLASIPNIRNVWLINQLILCKWDYEEAGLLDVTHIRFFTMKGVIDLFSQTGYSIAHIERTVDVRVPEIVCPPGGKVDVKMPSGIITALGARDVWELRTLQFLVSAKPVLKA